MKSRYWYDEQTGEILHRTDPKGSLKFDMPYFDKDEQGWNWSNWQMNIETKKLEPRENPIGQGVDPRA